MPPAKKAKTAAAVPTVAVAYAEPQVMAEIGCNHMGRMETAVELSREGGFVPVAGRPHQVSAPDDGLLSVGCSNWRIGGQLEWPQPHCEPFRVLLCHPRLQPVLDTVLGRGYRLDHGPYVAIMRDGCGEMAPDLTVASFR